MKSLCAWFEIPVTDYNRAKEFYEAVLQLPITDSDFGDVKMGMFPFEDYANSGSITLHEGYEPSTQGTLVYLNVWDDLRDALSRVEPAGGKVLTPKTKITDEHGYFAVFADTEGNRVAFHSMK